MAGKKDGGSCCSGTPHEFIQCVDKRPDFPRFVRAMNKPYLHVENQKCIHVRFLTWVPAKPGQKKDPIHCWRVFGIVCWFNSHNLPRPASGGREGCGRFEAWRSHEPEVNVVGTVLQVNMVRMNAISTAASRHVAGQATLLQMPVSLSPLPAKTAKVCPAPATTAIAQRAKYPTAAPYPSLQGIGVPAPSTLARTVCGCCRPGRS